MNPIIVAVLSYLTVFLITFLFISLLQKGFFWSFLKVKTSAGKKVLVRVVDINNFYFKTGNIIDGEFLKFRDKDKSDKLVTIVSKTCIYRQLGVSCLDYDVKHKCLIDYGPEIVHGVTSHDHERENSLHERALMRPDLLDPKIQIIMILLIFAILLLLVNAFLSYQSGKKLDAMAPTLNYIAQMMTNASNTII